jgi:serine incorporator 1/3
VPVLSWVNVGLLPSTAVSCYLVFMCYQAVHSNPDETCTYVDTSSTKSVRQSAFLSAALAALTITWTSWRVSATKTNLLSLSPSSSSRPLAVKHDPLEDDGVIVSAEKAEGDAHGTVPEYQYHLLMVLSCFYMAMVLTDWGSATGCVFCCIKSKCVSNHVFADSCPRTDTPDEKVLTMWVKIVSQWVAAALYLWTLIAPSVLTDREFGPTY